jgi:hypothetical protein
MLDFFNYIVAFLLDIVQYISHAFKVLFRNVVLLAFVGAFLYGIFRLCRYGWQRLRYLRGGGPPEKGTPKDKPEDGAE